MSALFGAELSRIPLFELLTIALSIGFILTLLKLSISKQWRCIKQPWYIWLIGISGIYGTDLLFYAALKHAPVAQIDLINYLWPIILIIATSLLPSEKCSWQHVLAGLIGLFAVYILLTNGQGFASFQAQYAWGYLLAFIEACVWVSYCLSSRIFYKTPIEMIGMYLGVGAIISLALHHHYETTIIPNGKEWLFLCCIGILASCGAYYFWDFAIKHGNIKLLSILSYGNPIISAGLLVLAGKAHLSPSLGIASLLIAIAAIVASPGFPRISQLIFTRLRISQNTLKHFIK